MLSMISMKTAVIINTCTKMMNYDLEDLSKNKIRLVAITSSHDFKKFNALYGKYFSRIEASPEPESAHLEKINFSFAKKIIQEELKNSEFLRVICQSEDNLLLAAQLRDELKIPGMGFEQTLVFRDKVLMKDALGKANIRLPKYKKFVSEHDSKIDLLFENLKTEFKLPFVIKPTKLLGGAGVEIIHSLKELGGALKNTSSHMEYEVEEFISGTLYHCDTIRQNGKTLFAVCCQYTNPNFDFQLGKSVISFPLENKDPIVKRIFSFNESVLDTLDFHTGTSHHEMFIKDSGEIVFLEIAARSPGAVVTPMYKKEYGIGFEDIAFKIEMQIPFTLPDSPLSMEIKTHYLSGIFPMIPGVVKELLIPNIKSQHKIKWLVDIGSEMSGCKGLRDISASIEAWNDDHEILENDFEILKNFQSVSVIGID